MHGLTRSYCQMLVLTVLNDPTIAVRLWNCDETAFSNCFSATKLLARRGCRNVHEIGGGSASLFTVAAVHLEKSYHPLFYIKGKICIRGGETKFTQGIHL